MRLHRTGFIQNKNIAVEAKLISPLTYAHPEEVKIVFLQHLVSSLSVSGRAVNRLRADYKNTILTSSG
jgi:hypothetical protein